MWQLHPICFYTFLSLELRINQVENVEYQLVKYFIHYYQLRILIFVKKKFKEKNKSINVLT